MLNFSNYITEGQQQFNQWNQKLSENPMLSTGRDLLLELHKLEPTSENYIVGGTVRDLLLNKPIKDVDIATSIDISKIEKTFRTDQIGKSKDFGIVNVHYGDYTFEVSHFRTDDTYSDFRRPDSVTLVNSFQHDAARRDLTINALGIDANGVIHDYVGGVDDIKAGLIRTVGEPFKRFTEDALRLMRVGRFAAKYGFKIDPETQKAITDLSELIKKVAPERIKDEIFKTAAISGPALARYIEHLKETGILKIILPEIDTMSEFEHAPETHPEGGVFDHTMAALRQSRTNDAVTNLAILFHDVGKPVSRQYNEVGRVKYIGHDFDGLSVLDRIAERLKFSKNEKDAIKFAIENHMLGHTLDKLSKSKLVQLRQNPHWDVLKNTIWADDQSRGRPLANPEEMEAKFQRVEDMFKTFGEKEAFEKRMSGFVDGRMIMALRPDVKGAKIGTVKDAVRDWIVQNDFNVTPEQVKEFILSYEV